MDKDPQENLRSESDAEFESYASQEIANCKQCGSMDVEEEYDLKLCKECRNKLSRRAFPIKVKLFLVFLSVIIIYSLVRFPSTIKIGVEYNRGLQAEKELKYVTAMNHYEKVLSAYPDSKKVKIKLYNAYYQNEEVDKAYELLDKLSEANGKKNKYDKATVDEVNKTTDKLNLYYSLNKQTSDKLSSMVNASEQEIINVLKSYVNKYPNEPYVAYYLASMYFNVNKFDEGIKILDNLTSTYPDYYSAYTLKASMYREIGEYDKAIDCCNKVFKHNSEDIGAYLARSQIELKRKNNAEGLKYAETAYKLNINEPYCIANLALAYHYNNKISERDKMFNKFKKEMPKNTYTIDLFNEIFNGTLHWQK